MMFDPGGDAPLLQPDLFIWHLNFGTQIFPLPAAVAATKPCFLQLLIIMPWIYKCWAPFQPSVFDSFSMFCLASWAITRQSPVELGEAIAVPSSWPGWPFQRHIAPPTEVRGCYAREAWIGWSLWHAECFPRDSQRKNMEPRGRGRRNSPIYRLFVHTMMRLKRLKLTLLRRLELCSAPPL